MSVVIGIDVGGSTTKIVGFRKENSGRTLLAPLLVQANDPLTSIYGAFGKFIDRNDLSLRDIEKVMMSGVGSSFVRKDLYNLPCERVPEFRGIGLGGMYLSGLSDCLVVSIGTGTAIVHAAGDTITYLGGTGVGGGTVMGLSKLILNADSIEHIVALSHTGTLDNIDLCIGDISAPGAMKEMPDDLTAANFGNVTDTATPADMAKGILNLVFETVGMVSVFAARSRCVRNIVLTGNLTTLDYCKEKFAYFNRLENIYGVNFCIPDNAQFATVIGTALCG